MWSPQKKKSPLKKSKPFSELDVKKPALSQAFLWVSSLVFVSILIIHFYHNSIATHQFLSKN